MPLFRRLPKRGFKNHFAKQYAEINIRDLNCFEDGDEITPEILANAGFFKPVKAKDGVKILGDGELTKKLTIKANKFTKSAEEKITKAGGKVEVI